MMNYSSAGTTTSSTTYLPPLHPQKVDKAIQVDPPAEAGSQTTPEPDEHSVTNYIDGKAHHHHLSDGSTAVTLQCTSTDGHHCTGCIEFNKSRQTVAPPVYASAVTTTDSDRSFTIASSNVPLAGQTAHYCDVHGTIQGVTVTPVIPSAHHHHQLVVTEAHHPDDPHGHHHHHQHHQPREAVQIHAVPHPHELQTVVADMPLENHHVVSECTSPEDSIVEYKDIEFKTVLSPGGGITTAPVLQQQQRSLPPKIKKALKNMRPYTCETCDKTFYKEEHLVQHRRVHSGERPFKCNMCDKTFRQSGALHNHKQIHVGSKNFHCDICNKSFAHARNLKCHVRTHTGERPYQCDQCHKCFTQAQHLAQHKKLHAGQTHACDECGQTFTHPSNLVRHKRIHAAAAASNSESPRASSSSSTSHAGQPLTNVTYQRIHVMDPNNPSGEPTSIVVAAASGDDESLDSEDRKYFMPPLDHSVAGDDSMAIEHKFYPGLEAGEDSRVAMEEQQRIGILDKFFPCDQCDKVFYEQVHLEHHRRSHDSHMFACDICGKGFTQPRNLQRHMLIHTGERPFSCPTCGKSFNQSTHLTKHMKLHGMELPYTCRRCGEKFRYKSERERHKKAFHAPQSPGTTTEDEDQMEQTHMMLGGGSHEQHHEVMEHGMVHLRHEDLSHHHHHHEQHHTYPHTIGDEDSLDADDMLDDDVMHHTEQHHHTARVVVVSSGGQHQTVYTTETGEIIDMSEVDMVEQREDGSVVITTSAGTVVHEAPTPTPTLTPTPSSAAPTPTDQPSHVVMAGGDSEDDQRSVSVAAVSIEDEDSAGSGGMVVREEDDDDLDEEEEDEVDKGVIETNGETLTFYRTRFKDDHHAREQTFLQS